VATAVYWFGGATASAAGALSKASSPPPRTQRTLSAVAPERALLTMPSEKLYAQPKSVPAPAPICFVVSTHSEPVLKKPPVLLRGAGNFAPDSVKSLTEASSMRVAIRQPAPRPAQ